MDEIINDFHDLDQIPVFQTQIDPEMMNTADRLDVLQMNIGRVCNLACKHCHVCAATEPDGSDVPGSDGRLYSICKRTTSADH